MSTQEPQTFRQTLRPSNDDETSETYRPHRGTITPLPANKGEGAFGEQHLYDEDACENAGDDELRDKQPGQDQRD